MGAPTPHGASRSTSPGLTERDKRVLDFERDWSKHAGAKDDAIRSEFGFSSARYYQVLNTVIDSPAAIVYDPMLVRRLQRVRDARMRARLLVRENHSDYPHQY